MCCADFNFYINRQGIQGRKGDKGETGFSPAISVGTDTPNEYKLIIANESNSFETPNLRGNINVLDNGGTYLRYDAETQQISAQGLDAATSTNVGGVLMSTDADIEGMGDGSVITPADLADALPIYLEGEGAVTITQDEETSKTKINVDLSSVEDLQSRVSAAEAEIVGIQADVADLDADNTDNKAIIDAHTNSIADINDSIASLQQTKQAKLTAGEGITIDSNNVISSTGGGGAGDVTAAGNNVFTGTNQFNKVIRVGTGNEYADLAELVRDSNLQNYEETITILLRTEMGSGIVFDSTPRVKCWNSNYTKKVAAEIYHQDNLKGSNDISINLNQEDGNYYINLSSALTNKITGLENSIGDIETVLDNINGEVI